MNGLYWLYRTYKQTKLRKKYKETKNLPNPNEDNSGLTFTPDIFQSCCVCQLDIIIMCQLLRNKYVSYSNVFVCISQRMALVATIYA